MSRRNYPRVESRNKVKPQNSQGKCQVMGCPSYATWVVWLQFGWFRGDGENVRCCDTHCTVRSVSESGEVAAFIEQFPPNAFR